MFRFVAITAFVAAIASPAFGEPGFVNTVSLPALGSSVGLAPRACEFPADLSVGKARVAPAAGHAMTLSPRMLQAIRIDDDATVN